MNCTKYDLFKPYTAMEALDCVFILYIFRIARKEKNNMDPQSQSISIPNSLLLSFYPLYSTIQSINCQFKRHGNSILSMYPLHFQNW